MSILWLEFLLIGILLLSNGLFAMSELAVVTARRSRLEALAGRGSRRARAALALAREPTAFLSSVQIGITLIGILAGAFGGARLALHLQPLIAQAEPLVRWSEEIAFGLVVGGITFASVIFGELVPKRLALTSPERVAMFVAPVMATLAQLLRPAVWLLSASTGVVFRVLGIRESAEGQVTEEDIKALIAQGRVSGSVHAGEAAIVTRVLRFGDRPVGAVMTPRPDIVWLDLQENEEMLRAQLATMPHRAVPVAAGSVDEMRGILNIRHLVGPLLRGEPLDLASRLEAPLYVPESLPLLQLIERFQESRAELAIVLDEYGGVQGLVTRSDILDDLATGMPGTVPGRQDLIARRPDGSWLVDGVCSLQDLEDAIGANVTSRYADAGVQTVAGLVLAELGRVPALGDETTVDGHRFRVEKMDGRRIERVLIIRPGREPGEEA
jgi:putative hemolysin